MSSVKAFGRALRRFQTNIASLRQLGIARMASEGPVKGRGYFRKHHALACPAPRCDLCGGRSAPSATGVDSLTPQERRHLSRMDAGLAELGGDPL